MHAIPFQPTISALLPSGWGAKESITLLSPDGQGNVIASSEPLEPSIDTRAYAEVQGDLLRSEFPGYQEAEFTPTELFGGKQGFLRRFAWTPPDSQPVTQTQIYLALSGRGYTATATTPTAELARLESQLIEILRSLTIEAPAGG